MKLVITPEGFPTFLVLKVLLNCYTQIVESHKNQRGDQITYVKAKKSLYLSSNLDSPSFQHKWLRAECSAQTG